MGQYYQAAIFEEDGKLALVLDPIDNHDGYKLMEHSYMDCAIIRTAENALLGVKRRVIWVGDYSNDYELNLKEGTSQKANEALKKIYKGLWGKETKKVAKAKLAESSCDGFDHSNYALINHSKRLYITYKDYLERSKHTDDDGWDFTIAPLPLLTAIGNGRGGGDYWDGEGHLQVGKWAYDLLSIDAIENIPEGFRKLEVKFWENF